MRKAIIYGWILVLLACASAQTPKKPPAKYPEGDATVTHRFQEMAETIMLFRALNWIDAKYPPAHADKIKKALLQMPRPTIYWAKGKCRGTTNIAFRGSCFHGIMWRWDRIYVSVRYRIADSAFTHEMSHAYRILLKGDGNGKHDDHEWWDYWSVDTNAIIRKAENRFLGGASVIKQGVRDRQKT